MGWAKTAQVQTLIWCESRKEYGVVAVNSGVTYYGAFQANADFWITYGGDPAYLNTNPFTAPKWMQNKVAYNGYLARGWEPWECSP